ncbi:MAG: hypothetical protein H0V54_16380 [Chthoniobacterales bacterium]|nr:hypothetical protein [Chthoniobacterales bacterium]
MKKKVVLSLAFVVAFATIASQLQAVPVFVGSRAALNGNDFIDWGAAGPEFTVLASPFTIPTNLGMTATVSTSNGTNLERRDQGSSWSGNFAPGDPLIWNQDAGGDIVVNFGMGVFGVGAQVQADFFGPFTGTISAFGMTGNLLGSFTFNGNSTSDGDNSAVFAGILNDTADIFSVSFSVLDQFGQNAFAINQLDIVKGGSQGVPESGATLPLLGLGIVALGFMRKFARA